MAYVGNQPYQAAFVTDTFNGTGSATVFTMSVAPANTASVLVAVSGVLQDPSTYSVTGTTLTFSAAPPSGTGNISCRYLGIPASGVTTTAYRTVTEFTATAGQTTFTPPSYTVGFISVYRNGVLLGSADYTATNGTTVVLSSAAALNDLVTVESFYVSSVLNAIPATAGAVNSTYLASSLSLTTPTIAQINSASSGTPTVFADSSGTQVGTLCRAWVNFNGTSASPITPRANFNVSSVTKSATGQYVLNFASALSDANYACSLSTGSNSGTNTLCLSVGTSRATYPTTGIGTSSCAVSVATTGGTAVDPDYVFVSIHR